MTHAAPRRLVAVLGVLVIAAACSGTGGPPASSATATFPPLASASAAPSTDPWPEDWPAAICEARTTLDSIVDDVTKGIRAADDADADAVRDDAAGATSAVAGVVQTLDATTEWDRGRGVAVNLRAAATHLGNASRQLTNWSTRATAARLSAAKTYLGAAKTSLARAATNQKTLAKTTGFSC